MKNAKTYEKKVRKLLGGMDKSAAIEEVDRVTLLVLAVLEEDSTPDQAAKALEAMNREFVDFNEARVSPHKEIAETVAPYVPDPREKADRLTAALNAIFERQYAISMDYMEEMTKRDLRRHLGEIGLTPYASARVVLAFDGHAVPVDESLVASLDMEDCIHTESEIGDVQDFLERIVPQKNAIAAHLFFRKFVKQHSKQLEAKRSVERESREKARQEARELAERQAREKAEQEARETARQVAAEREAHAKAAKKGRTKAGKKTKKTKTAKTAKKANKTKKATKAVKKTKSKKAAKKAPKKAAK